MSNYLTDALEEICRVDGVRGALLVAVEDGLVVAEAAIEGIATAPVAALAASLATRLRQATAVLRQPAPTVIHLEATEGGLLMAAGESGLLLVAVTEPDANAGLIRLALLDAAGRLA